MSKGLDTHSEARAKTPLEDEMPEQEVPRKL